MKKTETPSYLEAQVELLERHPDDADEEVHPLALLEGDHDVGRPLLHLARDVGHVELLGQLLQDLVQGLLHLKEARGVVL